MCNAEGNVKKDFYIKVLVARTINVTLLMYMLNSSVANGFTVGATEGATCWGQIICKLISAANIYLFQPHHQKITAAGLGLVKYTYEEGSDSIIFAPDVIQSISDANARQDLDQAALYHFDNEVFLPSLTLLDIEYKELSNELSKEGAAISAAKAKELREPLNNSLR